MTRLISRLTAPHDDAANGDGLKDVCNPCGTGRPSSSLSGAVDGAADEVADEDDETGACEAAGGTGRVSFVRGCTAVSGDGE